MPGFLGYRSVLSDLRKHLRQTGKVVSATLHSQSAGNVAYKYAYVWPQDTTTGIGGDGHPDTIGKITLWRTDEETAPIIDDTVTVSSSERQIIRVQPRLNADESRNFAVYDLIVVT